MLCRLLWATHGWKTFSYEVKRRDYSGRFNRRAAEHVHDDLAKKAKEVASLKAELQAKFPEAMKEYEEVIATIMAGKVSFLSIASLFSNFFSCSIIFFLFFNCFFLFSARVHLSGAARDPCGKIPQEAERRGDDGAHQARQRGEREQRHLQQLGGGPLLVPAGSLARGQGPAQLARGKFLSQFLKLLVEFFVHFSLSGPNVSFSSPGLQSRLQLHPGKLGVAERGRPRLGDRDQGHDPGEEEGHRHSQF